MDDAELWLVAGLGNPGPRYAATRHNVGFMVVDALAEAGKEAFRWKPASRFQGTLAKGKLSGRDVVLAKPETYMNLSGRCVGPLARFYRVPLERIIVVHDDIDLALGRVKVKRGGGDGGHNGLRSLTEVLGSGDYARVRCGVGRPAVGDPVDHVLSPFREEELEAAGELVARAAKAVRVVMTRGVKEAMNRFNRAPRAPRATAASGDETSPPGDERAG